MELKRVIREWKLWLALALLLLGNIFCFYQEQKTTYGSVAAYADGSTEELLEEYRALLAQYETMEPSEALADCEAKIAEYETTGNFDVEYYTRKEYVQPYLKYFAEYPAYLEKVQENAKTLGVLSLFSKQGSFSQRNLRKTSKDFLPLEDVSLQMDQYLGVEALIQYPGAEYLIMIWILLLIKVLTADIGSGLQEVVFTTPNGRWRLAVKRLLIFCAAVLFAAVLLYGETVLLAENFFGTFPGDAAAQSVQSLGQLAEKITVREFLLQFLGIKLGGMVLIGLVLWMVLLSANSFLEGLLVIGLVFAGEYVCYALLPIQSVFNILKYINLFTYLNASGLYMPYLNVNLFGYPVHNRTLAVAALPVLIIAGSAVQLCRMSLKTHWKRGWLAGWIDRLRAKTDRVLSSAVVGVSEWYKAFVIKKGFLILLLLCIVVFSVWPVFGKVPTYTKSTFELMLEEWEGPVGAESDAKIAVEVADIDRAYAEYAEKEEAYRNGSLSDYEYDIETALMNGVNNRYTAVQDVLGRVEQLKQLQSRGITGWLLNYHYVMALFLDENSQKWVGLLGIVFVVLFCGGIYAEEWDTGTIELLRGTKKGRLELALRKERLATLLAFVTFLLIYGTEFYSVMRTYGVTGLNAPMQSVIWFYNSDWHLCIWQYLLVIGALRFLLLWTAAQVTLLISVLIRKSILSTAVSVLFVAGTSAIWCAGVDIFDRVSLARYAIVVWRLQEGGFCGIAPFLPYLVIFLIGVGCAVLAGTVWIRNRK